MLMLLLAVCVYVSNTRMSICYINRYTCIADVHMYVGMIYLKYEYIKVRYQLSSSGLLRRHISFLYRASPGFDYL